MADLYARIAEIPRKTQEMLSEALTTRAKEAQMIAMRRRYFSWLDLPEGSRGLEIGSGPGHVSADLLASTDLAEVVGLDPSPVLVERANAVFSDTPGLSFVEGDARSIALPDQSFDLVVLHTSLCHIPNPDAALAEAARLLKPGGQIAVFDGDYATMTLALGRNDPIQSCAEHFAANLIHDIWLCRSLPQRLRSAGFEILRRDAHPYLAEGKAEYFLSIVTRGADFLRDDGLISDEAAEMLKREAQSRIQQGSFFGFISFNSVIARRPV